jgi:hypothetical protein
MENGKALLASLSAMAVMVAGPNTDRKSRICFQERAIKPRLLGSLDVFIMIFREMKPGLAREEGRRDCKDGRDYDHDRADDGKVLLETVVGKFTHQQPVVGQLDQIVEHGW